MKCNSCGKELKDLGIQLTNEECLELELAYTKQSNANVALKPDVIKGLDLHDADLYAYIKANSDLLAESIFLEKSLIYSIKEKYNFKDDNVVIVNGSLYLHE